MDIVRALIFLILLCCIYNILKIANFKRSSSYNSKYSSSSYNNASSSFGNNVRGHCRRTKSGKTVYVNPYRRKRR